jgi:hypothetical protein
MTGDLLQFECVQGLNTTPGHWVELLVSRDSGQLSRFPYLYQWHGFAMSAIVRSHVCFIKKSSPSLEDCGISVVCDGKTLGKIWECVEKHWQGN